MNYLHLTHDDWDLIEQGIMICLVNEWGNSGELLVHVDNKVVGVITLDLMGHVIKGKHKAKRISSLMYLPYWKKQISRYKKPTFYSIIVKEVIDNEH